MVAGNVRTPRLAALGVVAGLAILAGSGAPATAVGRLPLVAHRGDTNPLDGFPENTVKSLQQAVWRGADGIEFDVQASADGTLWLMHDETVDRTTTGSGRIGALSDAQLAALKIDGGTGWRSGAYPIPRLADISNDGVAQGAIRLEVDLKDADDGIARRVAEWAAPWVAKTVVNVKSHRQAAIMHTAGFTVVAQPDWISDAITASDVDLVLVWGDELQAALATRPASQIELFRNAVLEAGDDEAPLLQEAVLLRLHAFLTDGLPWAQAHR